MVFQVDIHRKHYFPHLALGQVDDTHLRRRVFREDGMLLLLKLFSCDLHEICEFIDLVPSELDSDDKPGNKVHEASATFLRDVVDEQMEKLEGQKALDLGAPGHYV